MARARGQSLFLMPVLDRILAGDDEAPQASQTPEALKESIRRDLEILFNSRPPHREPPPHLEELATSVVGFGLSDLRTLPLADQAQRETFRLRLEAHIRRFEPRLRNLRVEIAPRADELERTLRFRIVATIATQAGDDSIVYDTLLDRASRVMTIDGEDEAG